MLIYAPIERYRPSCGDWKVRHYFNGPMRQVFVDKMTEAMAEDGFHHIRVGNSNFIRFHDVDDFLINNDWKIAAAIGLGYGPGDSRFTPTPILIDIMDKARHAIEGDPSPSETKKKREMSFLFRDDCELIRAAAIRIEDMAPEDLLRYVPKSPLPPLCTPYTTCGGGAGTVARWSGATQSLRRRRLRRTENRKKRGGSFGLHFSQLSRSHPEPHTII